MKKAIIFLIIMFTVMLGTISAKAYDPWVTIDTKLVDFDGINPIQLNGYTMVPARKIYEALDYDVTWENNTMYCKHFESTVVVPNNSDKFYLYSDIQYLCRGYMDCAAQNINGTFMVPVRLISASTRAYIKWAADTNEVRIMTNRPSSELNIVAHRGLADESPENTLASVIYSKKGGFSSTETDIRFTSDNVPVILHDETINRTARYPNGSPLERDINISSISFADVKDYDFGSFFSQKYTGEKIPSLIEYLTLCEMLGLRPIIEMREEITYSQIEYIVNLTSIYGLTDNIIFASFVYWDLQCIHDLIPSADLMYFVNSSPSSTVEDAFALKTDTNEVFLAPYHGSLDANTLQYAAINGIRNATWTLTNSDDVNKSINQGIDTLIVDNSSCVWGNLIR